MHPFSIYIKILAKGGNGINSLSQEQAYQAMKMITCYDVEAEQVGAFLMLLRLKELSADELAGFTQALRDSIPSSGSFHPDIDWAAYEGKKQQLPWFILAALILAKQGYSTFMHGMNCDDGKLYVKQALLALDIIPVKNLSQAEAQLKNTNFCYLDINSISSLTMELIEKEQLFSLKTPLRSIAKALNPMEATLSVIGGASTVFAQIHQQAAQLLQQTKAVIMEGAGGEFERIPDKSMDIYGVNNDLLWHETWDKSTSIEPINDDKLDLEYFKAVWQNKEKDDYAENAVIGTLAILIRALELEIKVDDAQKLAQTWWHTRLQT